MQRKFLLTAIGEDRPGIVSRLTEVLVSQNANLEESRMAILGGEFAAIVLIAVPEDVDVDVLTVELGKLQKDGITVTLKKTTPLDAARFADCVQYRLELTGADHEGIVFKISQLLRNHSINIQTMETEVVPAPMTATPLFQLRAVIAAPRTLSFGELKKQLDKVAEAESVDINIKEVDASTACAKR